MRLFFIGHGSASSISEFMYIVDLFRIRHPWVDVRYWILEFSKLTLTSCFGGCARVCVVVPVMLFSSKHVKYDLCVILGFLQGLNKLGIMLLSSELCSVLLTTKLIAQLIKTLMLNNTALDLSRNLTNSIVVTIFRGGSSLKVNALSYLLSRTLWEGIGCLWCETCFFGLTFPLVSTLRSLMIRASNVIILPVVLFYGDLYSSLRECKHITGCVFSVLTALELLFRHLRRVLLELSLGGCDLCEYKLAFNEAN
ncbi:MAG: hypothetical protein AAI946_00330 [Candidatus Hodgkinia cicadicola]